MKALFIEELKDLIREAHSQGVSDGHPMARVRKFTEICDYIGLDEFLERWAKEAQNED